MTENQPIDLSQRTVRVSGIAFKHPFIINYNVAQEEQMRDNIIANCGMVLCDTTGEKRNK